MELSKADKKTAREIIEKGLQQEFAKCLFDADTILDDWKNQVNVNRDAYHKLYKQIINFDKHIALRYDRITGSNYLFIIAGQLNDGAITENDLNGFTIEARAAIKMIAGFHRFRKPKNLSWQNFIFFWEIDHFLL